MSDFYTLKILKIKKQTKDAVSITFEIPKKLKKKFKFIAGQYITLKTTIDNVEVRRAYSICSSENVTDLTVAVKAVKNGTFSVFANKNLKEGQEIEVAKPEGKFYLKTKKKNKKNYIAFVAGSGITPVMSIIKSILENEPKSKVTLVYGNKSTFETIFFDELNALSKEHSNRFFIQYIYSKEQPKDALFGRIDVANTNYVLNKFKDIKFDGAYLCGPENMINTVKEVLLTKNYQENDIHFELFTASKKKTNNVSLDGNATITIMLDDEETIFNMKKNATILDAALKEDLDAPYSCQGGICSSCLAKVTHGNAIMDKNNILSEQEVADGFVLTCQAHPTTDKISIDYDEV
jgi:ring-1,2-phenylacetyl-CoA epoxidase subunit PaaE